MDETWDRAVTAAAAGEESPVTLTLDGAVKCPSGRLPASSLDRFPNLEHLSIASVRLASLEGFPRLPSLRRLILSDNRIAGGLEALPAAGLNALRDLDLSNNRIGSLEELEPLAKLGLVSLDLYECPVTKIKGYRERVFELIKTLKYLDKLDGEGNERPESDEDEDDEEDDDDEDEEGEEVAVNGKEGAEEDDENDEDSGDEDDEDEEDDEDGEEDACEDEEEGSGEENSVQPAARHDDGMEGTVPSSKKRKTTS